MTPLFLLSVPLSFAVLGGAGSSFLKRSSIKSVHPVIPWRCERLDWNAVCYIAICSCQLPHTLKASAGCSEALNPDARLFKSFHVSKHLSWFLLPGRQIPTLRVNTKELLLFSLSTNTQQPIVHQPKASTTWQGDSTIILQNRLLHLFNICIVKCPMALLQEESHGFEYVIIQNSCWRNIIHWHATVFWSLLLILSFLYCSYKHISLVLLVLTSDLIRPGSKGNVTEFCHFIVCI